MASTNEEEPVQKRGRGRPPKVPGQKKAAYVPTGRPRGRPKGSGGVKKATPAKKTTTSTGRRGRPRKSDVDATAAAAAAAADDTPAKKSGRGRPRKSDVSAAPTPKKGASKKGAKGKTESAEAESSSSDVEGEHQTRGPTHARVSRA
ncbi:hypothetical protein CSOJ01_03291 [Colletotrichum sojae]|uniref:AT hook domain-containing protein n=1 Tax=Colletotrichum sojae TaxID=2175907 RepID=A0A8H6JMV8_9PEZI|nr:hypothetical protein CSOJ01_03291 [Colletotrichum sojae]